jgi:hypothetical protein
MSSRRQGQSISVGLLAGRPDFKIGKGYEFRNVPAEKHTTLDLTESNAVVGKDFQPPRD